MMRRNSTIGRFNLTGYLSPVYFGGGPPSTQTTTQRLDPAIERQIQPFIDFTRKVVDQPFERYAPKKRIAEFNQDQLAAFDLARRGSGAQNQYADLLGRGPFQGGTSDEERQSSGFLRNILAGNRTGLERQSDTFLSGFFNPQANPFFESQLGIGRQRIGEQYAESIAPGLASKYALSGAFGGTAQAEAEGRSQRELARGLQEYESGARSAEVERRYQQGLQAAGLAEQAQARRTGEGLTATGQIEQTAGRRGQQNLADAALRGQLIGQQEGAFGRDYSRLLGVGQTQFDRDQALRDARFSEFQRRVGYPDTRQSIYRDAIAALLGGAPVNTTTTTAGGGPSTAARIGGGALSGAASGAALGTIVPGVGNLLGAGIGALAGGGLGAAK